MSIEQLRLREQRYTQRTMMDVCKIRFTQKSVNDTFSNGAPIKWTIHTLQTNQIEPCEIPLIRVGRLDGHWKSIDNRRLYCFKQSGMKQVPVIIMEQLTEEFHYKNQSPNNGVSAKVIHDPKPATHHVNIVTAYHPATKKKRTWTVQEIINKTKRLSSQSPGNSTTSTHFCTVCNRSMQAKDKPDHLKGALHKTALRNAGRAGDVQISRKDTFWCHLCDSTMAMNDKNSHLSGSRHRAALRKASSKSNAPATGSKGKSKNKAVKKGMFNCEVCESIMAWKDKINHLNGARHQAALREASTQIAQSKSLQLWHPAADDDEKSEMDDAANDLFWCSVCDRAMQAKDKNNHLKGKPHRTAAQNTTVTQISFEITITRTDTQFPYAASDSAVVSSRTLANDVVLQSVTDFVRLDLCTANGQTYLGI